MSAIRITEIGPRDGLQGEPQGMATADKLALIRALAGAGLAEIEVTALVHPRWIPNMADAEAVLAGLGALPARRWALVPNRRGLERALAGGLDGVTTVFSATEGHNRRNLNRGTEDSLREVIAVGQAALRQGLGLRASISTVFGCPFDGVPDPGRVLELVARLWQAGYRRVGLCDTLGVANPVQVRRLVAAVRARWPELDLELHFHNSYGRGLANVLAALEAGATAFDSAIGGLGGCPYAPGATGNIATEDLVAMLEAMGLATGVDPEALFHASALVAGWREQPLESQCWRAYRSRCPA